MSPDCIDYLCACLTDKKLSIITTSEAYGYRRGVTKDYTAAPWSHWCVSEHMASVTTALAMASRITICKHAIRSPGSDHVFCFRTLTGWSALANTRLF